MAQERIETQLWDFKKTFEMWECETAKRTEFQIEFVEQAASYANTGGGVLVVGITDNFPRKIEGLADLEEKVKSAKGALDKFSDNGIPTIFQQIKLKDVSGKDYDCLLIAVAQTKSVVKVKDQQGRIAYPIRQGTGKARSDYETVQAQKMNVLYDNYNFVSALDAFTNT